MPADRPGTVGTNGDRYAPGQHHRTLLRRRTLDEIHGEFPARSASKSRAEPIRDLLRDGRRAVSRRLGSEFGGGFYELVVGDAIAEADVHGSASSIESEAHCKWE